MTELLDSVIPCEKCGKERAYHWRDVARGRLTKFCQPCSVAVYNASRPPSVRTPEDKKRQMAEWYRKNKSKADAFAKEWRANARADLIDKFGGKCVKCGESDKIVLDFDHINNDGHRDSRKAIVFRVKEDPSRFQLLCKNCNWRKEYLRRTNAQ